ncbi:MAG: hypothetical protein ABWZ82_05300 [Candidatus Limnocylindrales bacterium]
MAKTVAEKLIIKPGAAIWASDPSRLGLIGPLPDGVRTVDALDQATAGILFADDAATIRKVLEARKAVLAAPDVLWVLYPKAGRTDINRDTLWPIVAGYGLRPITQVAVDDTWSALRFRPLKEGEAPFAGGRAPSTGA